jgi:hypothetical protein
VTKNEIEDHDKSKEDFIELIKKNKLTHLLDLDNKKRKKPGFK